jgi:mRNA-degrading endonuclease RelE of RelBE toxin-antitoxin system
MDIAFIETPDFTAVVDEYFGSDDEYAKRQQFLRANPERGAVIPGTSGLRKLRWPDPRRGKGRRGGLRVIYVYVPQVSFIIVLDVYDKEEADDLTPEGRKILGAVAESIRAYLLGRS